MRTLLSIFVLILLSARISVAQMSTQKNNISFNNHYVTSLENSLDLTDQIDVFRYVFASLDDEIFVYPTENYYYFTFNANGSKINGNIGFFADIRKEGLLNFAYYEETKLNNSDSEDVSSYRDLSLADGVSLVEIDPFTYTLSFEGHSVKVHLNDISRPALSRLVLQPDEEYIGTTFDESGLSFYLVINHDTKHLFWVLNEDVPVNDHYYRYTNEILIGKRTEFAFYNDTLLKRKILFGVQQSNVDRNTWFDGPFDQLPDNYVYSGKLDLGKYFVEALPYMKSKINIYGTFLDDMGSRVAVCSYFIYSRKEQLLKLFLQCKSRNGTASELITELTREREIYSRIIPSPN